jgi:cell division topological specificity factor
MLDFITKFFKREETSKTLAKERLRLVLMSDRVSLAPDVFDEMKCELLAVIRRYLEIDERALDMHFESLERQFALLASIPVLKVKTPEQIAHVGAAHSNGSAATNGAAAHNGEALANGTAKAGPPRRRRRRRRPAAADQEAPPAQPQAEDAPPQPPEAQI